MIDPSLMAHAAIDVPREVVQIGPGIFGGELDGVTQALKLVVPLGSCPSTGVVGYVLGVAPAR